MMQIYFNLTKNVVIFRNKIIFVAFWRKVKKISGVALNNPNSVRIFVLKFIRSSSDTAPNEGVSDEGNAAWGFHPPQFYQSDHWHRADASSLAYGQGQDDPCLPQYSSIMEQNVGLELLGCLVIAILLNLIVLIATIKTRQRRRAFKALSQALFTDDNFELSCLAEFNRVNDRNQAAFRDFCQSNKYGNHTDRQMYGLKRFSTSWEKESIKMYIIQWHLAGLASKLEPRQMGLVLAHMDGWDGAMSQYYLNKLTQAKFILPELEINLLEPEKWYMRLVIRLKQFFLDQAISPVSSYSDPEVPRWEKHHFA